MTIERHIVVESEEVSRREFDALLAMLGADARENTEWRERLPRLMADAVAAGIGQALSDEATVAKLHAELTRRTRQGMAEWVFDRLTTVVASLVIAAALTWFALVKGQK